MATRINRVQVSSGSGLDSGKCGVVVPNSTVPTNGRGIPQIAGAYKRIRRDEVVVQVDETNELIIMFRSCLLSI